MKEDKKQREGMKRAGEIAGAAHGARIGAKIGKAFDQARKGKEERMERASKEQKKVARRMK